MFRATCLVLGVCASACGPKGPAAPRPLGFGIIDAHTHTDFTGAPEPTSKVPVTEQAYFREWTEANVVGAVSHEPSSGKDGPDLGARNVCHCAGVAATVDTERVRAGLESGRYRCIKIYLGYVPQYASAPEYAPVYELAEAYDVPVVFHTGDTYSTTAKLKYADPLTIDEVAVDHPKVRFVIAHAGNPWIESAAEVAYKNPNVWLDGSAFLIGDLESRDPEEIEEYVVKPLRWIFGFVDDPTKLMFGSDWPLTRIAPYVRAFQRAIPEQHWRAVFHDNAAKVFKLDRPRATARRADPRSADR